MSWLLRVLGFAGLSLVLVLGLLGILAGEHLRHIVFAQNLWLLLLLVPALALGLRAGLDAKQASLRFTRQQSLRRLSPGFAVQLADLPDGLRLAAVVLLVLACARPQSTRIDEQLEHEGIDIAIVLDLSESMANDDIYPDRLTAAKLVIDEFIRRRPHDRIALVGFGSNASTIAPLTLDHQVLRSLITKVRLGVIEGQTTAIGAGLGVALNRLEAAPSARASSSGQASGAKSKVIVLLTDGVHNAAGIDPDTVAQEAAKRGVKVYTVLMGREFGGNVDSAQLERLASATGGYSYLASDVEALETSFQDLLDKLEKSVIAGEPIRAELFAYLLWPALLLLVIDVLLRNTRLRRFP